MSKKIQINGAIYPYVMSIYLGNKNVKERDTFTVPVGNEIEVSLDLPRDAFLMYLQNEANDNNKKRNGFVRKICLRSTDD